MVTVLWLISQPFVALMAGTFYIKFDHNLCIIKINECLVAKNLLTNVTKMNKHSNVTTFVHALALCGYINLITEL